MNCKDSAPGGAAVADAAEKIRAVAEAARVLRNLRHEIMQANGWPLRELYKSLETPGENRRRTAHAASNDCRCRMPRTIGRDVDFAQEVKLYANPKDGTENERRYSTSRCIGHRIHIRRGNPNPDLISTAYMERTNSTVRMFNRRLTRLTLGYSKKFEYLIHSINLMVFYYNFIWIHGTHGMTPAMAAGLKSEAMTFESMLLTPD